MDFQDLIISVSVLLLNFVYVGISFNIVTNKKSLKPIIAIMILLFFQSYIFINLKSYNESFYYFYSLSKETIFASLILFILMKRNLFFGAMRNKFLVNYFIVSILLSLYGIAVGLSKGYSLFNVFLGARDIMLPIFFFYLFL